jgi:hypothetical protein
MQGYDPAKWAVITPTAEGKLCDITTLKAAVFSVDLEPFATACAAIEGCTFDKSAYQPYAFGLWIQ